MKKTSLYLQPELDRAIGAAANRRQMSKAEFIRQALASVVADEPPVRFTAVGVITTPGRTDISANVDAYLAETGFGDWRHERDDD